MTSLPDPTSVPANDEHMEAYQSAVDTVRAESVAAMKPEERVRMTAMESAVRILEEAKVPFALWGNPLNEDTGVQFWRFNRLEYMPSETSFRDRADKMMKILFWRLAPTISQWLFASAIRYAAYYDENRKLVYAYDMSDGQYPKIVLPEDEAPK